MRDTYAMGLVHTFSDEFKELYEEYEGNYNDEYNTNSKKYKKSPIKYLKEIRALSMEIMQDRNYQLSERFYILGDFIKTLEEKIEKEPSEVTLTDTKNPVNTEDDVVNTNEVQEKENKVDDANEDNINQGNKEDENDNNEDTNIVESNENEDETKNKNQH